jgi:hypothetical protein
MWLLAVAGVSKAGGADVTRGSPVAALYALKGPFGTLSVLKGPFRALATTPLAPPVTWVTITRARSTTPEEPHPSLFEDGSA